MSNKEAVNWLINVMADIGKAEHSDLWHYEQALMEIREMLESQPERKKGKWIWSSDEYGESWICSECMAEYSDFEGFKDEAKYCPNCGADLREGAEQE